MRKALFVVGLIIPVASFGDVTLVHKVTSNGYHGMGSSETLETRVVQPRRSREDAKTQFTGKVLGSFAGDRERVTLIKLDEGVVQTLHPSKKTYDELTFDEMRAAQKSSKEAKEEQQTAPEKPTHRISKATFNVMPTTDSKTINGFPCKKYVLKMDLVIEDLETHASAETRMENILWTTPETDVLKKAQAEEAAFSNAYLQKLGLDTLPRDLQTLGAQMAASLSGAGEKELGKVLSRIPAEMKKVKGYPVVTQVDWYFQGADSPTGAKAPDHTAEDTGIDTSNGVSGALGSLAGNWAKKKMNQKIDERAKSQAGKPTFSVISELQSVSASAASDEQFAIPSGYKRASK